jgi:hypothetical protein
MTALAIRRLMFQHGELQQQLAAVTRERDDAVAAYRVLEAEGNRCIDEYISGKLTQLRVWSDRMATAIAKSRNSLPAPTDRSGA